MKTNKNIFRILTMVICFILFSTSMFAISDPTDTEITNAVSNELLFNATTPAYLLDVETNEGIVLLSGSVDNILAKDRAVKIAQTVKGVRAVIDSIQVNAPYRTDAELENDIINALLTDPATDSYEINVKANEGHIKLSGNVDSWQEKQLSEYVTKGIVGVKSVENNISINYTLNRPDYEIREEVKQSLANDIRIDDGLINVSVQKGNVVLTGEVGSASEKAIAYSKAWTAGVKSVNSENLKVSLWSRDDNFRESKYVFKPDNEIKNAVKDALFYDPRVLSFMPEISVDQGVVTLTGRIDNLKAKKAAEQTANNVVGVSRVKNYLKVRPAIIPANKDLEADIETAMLKNPIVEMWEIDVKAHHGIVYLNGIVDSYFEKSTAEDIASKTNGVLAVENNLTVQDNNDYYFYDYYGWNTYFPPYQVDIVYDYRSDYAIKQDIIDEIWWSPYVNEDEVEVTVENGTATLTGTVDTKREKVFAEINALEGGALDVNNKLMVEYTP